jgi:hypothetical protein
LASATLDTPVPVDDVGVVVVVVVVVVVLPEVVPDDVVVDPTGSMVWVGAPVPTVTEDVAFVEPSEAAMTAAPSLMPVTTPFAATFATIVSLELHMTVPAFPVILRPWES